MEAEAAALGGRLEAENMLMYALQVQTRAFTSLKKKQRASSSNFKQELSVVAKWQK